jgi:hypothetical protein
MAFWLMFFRFVGSDRGIQEKIDVLQPQAKCGFGASKRHWHRTF